MAKNLQTQTTISMSAMRLVHQKIALENAGAAVGLGCFSIPPMPSDGDHGPSPYLLRQDVLKVRDKHFDEKLLRVPKKTKSNVKLKSITKLAKNEQTLFKDLRIKAPPNKIKKYSTKSSDMSTTGTIQAAELVTTRKKALRLLHAKRVERELRPYTVSSLTLKSTLSPLQFQQALTIANRACFAFEKAQEFEKVAAYNAFAARAQGDAYMHSFVKHIVSQNYEAASCSFAGAVRHYLHLRQLKTSAFFTRNEFSFHEGQDKQRLCLLAVSPTSMVNAFASSAAISALHATYEMTKNATTPDAIEQADAMLAVANTAYDFIKEPKELLENMQNRIDGCYDTLDQRDTQAQARIEAHEVLKKELLDKTHALHNGEVNDIQKLIRKAEMLRSYQESVKFRQIEKQNFIRIRANASVTEATGRGARRVRSTATDRKCTSKKRKERKRRIVQERTKTTTSENIRTNVLQEMRVEKKREGVDYDHVEKSKAGLLTRMQGDLETARAMAGDSALNYSCNDEALSLDGKLFQMRYRLLNEIQRVSEENEVGASTSALLDTCLALGQTNNDDDEQ